MLWNRKAISTFINSEGFRTGDREVQKAVNESMLSVVVFSQNYAFSKWCLMELVKIMECMDTKNQIVLPVFYEINPADVRYQRGRFGEAFDTHEYNSRGTNEELQKWRSALARAANLTGWDSNTYQ